MKNQQIKLFSLLNEHRQVWELNREVETAGVDYYIDLQKRYKIPISYVNKFFKLGIMIDPLETASRWELNDFLVQEDVFKILGWKIIRFSQNEIDEDIDYCENLIYRELTTSFLDLLSLDKIKD
jgi:hypothetical protein